MYLTAIQDAMTFFRDGRDVSQDQIKLERVGVEARW
jgi:hypothetical protein